MHVTYTLRNSYTFMWLALIHNVSAKRLTMAPYVHVVRMATTLVGLPMRCATAFTESSIDTESACVHDAAPHQHRQLLVGAKLDTVLG